MRNLTTHYKAIRKPHESKRKRTVRKSTHVRRTKVKKLTDEGVVKKDPLSTKTENINSNVDDARAYRQYKSIWDM